MNSRRLMGSIPANQIGVRKVYQTSAARSAGAMGARNLAVGMGVRGRVGVLATYMSLGPEDFAAFAVRCLPQ